MTIAFIGLGSNLHDRVGTIKRAISEVAHVLILLAASSIYETEPWGFPDQPKFLNAVIKVETDLDPETLLIFLSNLEASLGRIREHEIRWGPRVIDLDILLYGDQEVRNEHLVIPHPRIKERAFVLIPLYEIHKEKWVDEALGQLSDKEKAGVKRLPL